MKSDKLRHWNCNLLFVHYEDDIIQGVFFYGCDIVFGHQSASVCKLINIYRKKWAKGSSMEHVYVSWIIIGQLFDKGK